jgi:hypothetical protein
MTEDQNKIRNELELYHDIRMTKDGWKNFFKLFRGHTVDEIDRHPEWFGEILDEAEHYDKYCRDVYDDKPLEPITPPITSRQLFAMSQPIPTNVNWTSVVQVSDGTMSTVMNNSTRSVDNYTTETSSTYITWDEV